VRKTCQLSHFTLATESPASLFNRTAPCPCAQCVSLVLSGALSRLRDPQERACTQKTTPPPPEHRRCLAVYRARRWRLLGASVGRQTGNVSLGSSTAHSWRSFSLHRRDPLVAACTRVQLRCHHNGRYLCTGSGAVPLACAVEPCCCDTLLLQLSPLGTGDALLRSGDAGARLLALQPGTGLLAAQTEAGSHGCVGLLQSWTLSKCLTPPPILNASHTPGFTHSHSRDAFTVRLHRGGCEPVVSVKASECFGEAHLRCGPWRHGATALRAERGANTPGRRGLFAMQLAGGGGAVLLQHGTSGCLLAPATPFGRSRRTEVAWHPLGEADAASGWCLEYHGGGRYTLQVASDASPRRVLALGDPTPDGKGYHLAASSFPGDSFPAVKSLFTIEAVASQDGALAGWCLKSALPGVARGLSLAHLPDGTAALLPTPRGADLIRVLDVASAAASPQVLRADAPAASHAAEVTSALRALCTDSAVPPRHAASLRAMAVAALSREAGVMGADTPPPAALSESDQVALYGGAFLPDDLASDVAKAWSGLAPDEEALKPCKTAHEAPLFPGAVRCSSCCAQVFSMAPATHPGHHQFLESASGALRGRGRRGPDSPGGQLFTAVGMSAVVTMSAMVAASFLRIALRQRSAQAASREEAQRGL
jgi:hypothetical protein